MLEKIPPERRLLFVFLSRTEDGSASTSHSPGATSTSTARRILARAEVVKGRRGRRKSRWLQIPEWLMELLLDTCPPEDRVGARPLFPWLHGVQHPIQAANKTMAPPARPPGSRTTIPMICVTGGSRSGTGRGSPPATIGDRAGQRQIAVTLDTYTHVMPLGEVSETAFLELLRP